MPDRTFQYQGAEFKVAEGEPSFDGGAGHAVIEIDGCRAATISQKFTCGAALMVKIPLGSTYRFGFVQMVRSLERVGFYTDGCVQWAIKKMPMYDSSERSDNVAFPFTKNAETVVLSGRANRADQFCYVRTRDRPRIGFPLEFPNEYLGVANGKMQKLLMVTEKVGLTTWLTVREDSLGSEMKHLLPLGVVLWDLDVEINIDSRVGKIRETDTRINSSVGGWEFCRDGETLPTCPAEAAVWAQKQYWAPDHGTRVRFHRGLLPEAVYRAL